MLVLIKGAGDLATGTAVRLHRAGFRVVMTDIARPTAVRRTVAFCQCMYDGTAQVEGIAALDFHTALTISTVCAWSVFLIFLLAAAAAVRKNLGKRHNRVV